MVLSVKLVYLHYMCNSTDTWFSVDGSNHISSKYRKINLLLSTGFLSYLTKISEETEVGFHVVKCPLQCLNE